MNRRTFLTTAAAAVAAPTFLSAQSPTSEVKRPRIKLGVSTYSYWHFRSEKVRVDDVIDSAALLGVEGVDILHRQMDIDETGPLNAEMHRYCQRLKRHAFRSGVDLICLSTHQDFVSPNPAERHKWIAH